MPAENVELEKVLWIWKYPDANGPINPALRHSAGALTYWGCARISWTARGSLVGRNRRMLAAVRLPAYALFLTTCRKPLDGRPKPFPDGVGPDQAGADTHRNSSVHSHGSPGLTHAKTVNVTKFKIGNIWAGGITTMRT